MKYKIKYRKIVVNETYHFLVTDKLGFRYLRLRCNENLVLKSKENRNNWINIKMHFRKLGFNEKNSDIASKNFQSYKNVSDFSDFPNAKYDNSSAFYTFDAIK